MTGEPQDHQYQARDDELPTIDDASQPEPPSELVIQDDSADSPDAFAYQFDAPAPREAEYGAEVVSEADAPLLPAAEDEGQSDVSNLKESIAFPEYIPQPRRKGEWQYELSSHRVAVELMHLESEIRSILEPRDPKRKRKLSGSFRWQELQDDILQLKFTGRIEDGLLRRLTELVARRNYLFKHLRFLASTRPTWNT